jgi:hypothetical protein
MPHDDSHMFQSFMEPKPKKSFWQDLYGMFEDLVGRDDEDEEKGGRICTALRFSKTWWENWWAKLAYYYALQVGIRLKIVQIGISFEQSGILTI